jgi:hypothetical protein
MSLSTATHTLAVTDTLHRDASPRSLTSFVSLTHSLTHSQVCTHVHTFVHVRSYTLDRTHTFAHTRSYTCLHTLGSHILVRTHLPTHSHSRSYTHSHSRTYVYSHTHSLSLSRMHTRIHTYLHTFVHTHNPTRERYLLPATIAQNSGFHGKRGTVEHQQRLKTNLPQVIGSPGDVVAQSIAAAAHQSTQGRTPTTHKGEHHTTAGRTATKNMFLLEVRTCQSGYDALTDAQVSRRRGKATHSRPHQPHSTAHHPERGLRRQQLEQPSHEQHSYCLSSLGYWPVG